MLALKYMLIVIADLMFVAAFSIVINDLWMRLSGNYAPNEAVSGCPMHWRSGVILGALAWLPLLLAIRIAAAGS